MLRGGRGRRPAGGGAARHPAVRAELPGRVRAGDRLLRLGVQPGADAQPVRAVQRLAEIRPAGQVRRGGRGRLRGQRALRPDRHRRGHRPAGPDAGRGPQEGPELRPVRHAGRGGRPDAAADRRAGEAGRAGLGRRNGAAGVQQARQPGDLLRARRRLRRPGPAADAGGVRRRRPGHDRRCRRRHPRRPPAVHGRPAEGAGPGARLSGVRGRDRRRRQPGHPRRPGCVAPGRAAGDGVQPARGPARPDRPRWPAVRGEDPLQRRRRPRPRPGRTGPSCGCGSTSRSRP